MKTEINNTVSEAMQNSIVSALRLVASKIESGESVLFLTKEMGSISNNGQGAMINAKFDLHFKVTL